jgi:UDP-glucuronate 4-epimerase
MKILLTGAAGFIGSHLSERLLESGYEILALDNFDAYYDIALKEERVARLREYSGFALERGDIRDAALVSHLTQSFAPERIVHLAARAGVRPSIEAPAEYCAVNVTGTANIFEAARVGSTPGKSIPVVFASSSSVYGDSATPPYSENEVADFPVSPYAATKRAGELLAYTYHHLYQLPITCLRFFTVYGPRQRPDMAIHKFSTAILNDRPITLFGDGTTARDYTFIGDIVDGLVASIERAPDLGYEILNLGGGQTISLRALVEKIESIADKKACIEWQGDQPGDVKLTSADISRAREKLGYNPQTSIDEGLRATIEWLRAEQK